MEAAFEQLYAKLGPRYFLAYRIAYIVTGAAMCVLAAAVFSLYQQMELGQFLRLLAFATACTLVALGWGAAQFKRITDPIEGWIRAGGPAEGAASAWRLAAAAPRIALRQQLPKAIALAAVPVAVFVTVEFDLSLAEGAILLIAILAAAIYPTLLHYFGLELYLRPVLRRLSAQLPAEFRVARAGVALRWRLFLGLALINVATGIFVSVFSTTGHPSFEDLGLDVAVAVATSLTTSLLLVALLAETVLAPVGDLVRATREIRAGELSARAPLTSQDEIGMLTASFNEMTADLQRSREILVSAREEERRRLRRDLHDGLGPTLAAVALQLDAARNVLAEDPRGADALLERARTAAEGAIADLRRLVYELRPPQLDELGLVRAIEGRAASFRYGGDGGGSGVTFEVLAPERLPPLPAAVEVAAFRIAEEALTNVVRHSEASRCTVRLSVGSDLELEVADDGRGPAATEGSGIGLVSMRERAAELGGNCTVATRPGGGTLVQASLPLEADGSVPR